MSDFDVIVVGAGPAGAAAAIEVARSGRSVCLIERGPYPGSKNMYGGVIYGRILDTIIPEWWNDAPIQRWVTRRSTMMITGDQAHADTAGGQVVGEIMLGEVDLVVGRDDRHLRLASDAAMVEALAGMPACAGTAGGR